MFNFLKNRKSKSMIQNAGFSNIQAPEFENLYGQHQNAQLIDVRTPSEHSQARIPQSILLNIMDADISHRIQSLDRSKAYFLYCHSGSRSMSMCKYMTSLGFSEIYNLRGGLLSWRGQLEKS